MSTENFGEAKKAKPFLRKTKFILEKNRKIKILGGFVKNGMAWMARKKLLFLLVGMAIGIIIIYGIYFFYLLAKGGEKKKVYIIRKEIIKQFFKL